MDAKHSHHSVEASAPANAKPERSYVITYLLQDGTQHQEHVNGHGHHEAVKKVLQKGATDILQVARADHHSQTIKVKKNPLMLILKIAAALLATATVYFLIVSFA